MIRPSPIRLVVPPVHAGERLDRFLAAATGLPRRSARSLIASGAVLRNGRPVRVQSRTLDLGDVVDLPSPPPATDASALPPTPDPAILFEDRWLLVADKPAGVLSQPAEESRGRELAIDEQLLLALAAREGRRPFLRLVHRLDRLTSGAVLLARSPAALAPLAEAWRTGRVDRRYLAVVAGNPSFEATEVDQPIGRDPDHRWRFRADPSGRPAQTSVRMLERFPAGAALVECRLRTGRTHQVRVHLAELGHPVVGDRLYGAPDTPAAARPLLHASLLELPHPRTGAGLTVESPLPTDIRAALEALGRGSPPDGSG